MRSFSLHMKPGDAAAVLIVGLPPMSTSINSWFRFLRATAKPRGSDPGLLAEMLIIFPPAASALANGFIILDELDCADVLHHREPKLRFNAKAERCSVHNRQRLAVHFVGKNRLRIFRQLYANRAVEVPRSLGVWLRCGFIVKRVENDVAGGGKRLAKSDDVMQRYTTSLRNA